MGKLIRDLRGEPKHTSPIDFSDAFAAVLTLGKAFPRRVRHVREAVRRLQQLEWITHRVWKLEAEVGPGLHFSIGSDARMIELVTLTESAYYIAFRVRGVIQHIGVEEGSVECRNLEAKAVRQVRNQLIEHAEKEKPLSFDFVTGGGSGPQMKFLGRYRHKEAVVDQGFYSNIVEFLGELVRRAERCGNDSL